MKAYETTLVRFLEGSDKQFIVPLYQRAYNWANNECEQLFNDIKSATKNNIDSYFLGTIVSIVATENGILTHILIDGQQRLTTVSLLIKAIIVYVDKNRNNFIITNKINIEKLNENYLIDKYSNESSKLKLKQANYDADIFANLVEHNQKNSNSNSNIIKNYNYFFTKMKSLSDDEIIAFIESINKLTIVAITLKEEDKPQLIFESLNSTGLKLQDSDLIRNYILMGLPPKEQSKIYKNYWQLIEKNTLQQTNDFMWCYLIATYPTKNNIKQSDVYKEFKKYISYQDKRELTKENELQNMLEYSIYYNYLQESESSPFSIPSQIYIKNSYTIVDTTKFFLIQLIASYQKEEGYIKNSQALEEILFTLYTFIVRKFIMGQTIGLNKLLMPLHKRIIKNLGNSNTSYQAILEDILVNKKIAYTGNYPNDEDFKRELLNQQTHWHKVKHIKQILHFVEYRNNLKEKIDLDTLSIEHIMPQNGKKWHSLLQIDEDTYNKAVHNLGNITLTGYNVNSNKTYEAKRPILLASKFNILNQEIQQNEHWNLEIIEQRSKRLADIIIKTFPMPSNVVNIYQSATNKQGNNNEYFLSELITNKDIVTNAQLHSFSYQDNQYTVKDFANLIRILIKEELYSEDKQEIFQKLKIIKLPLQVKQEIYSEDNLLTPELYIYTNLSNVDKINYLQDMFNQLNLDYDDLIITLKNNSISS